MSINGRQSTDMPQDERISLSSNPIPRKNHDAPKSRVDRGPGRSLQIDARMLGPPAPTKLGRQTHPTDGGPKNKTLEPLIGKIENPIFLIERELNMRCPPESLLDGHPASRAEYRASRN